MFRMFRTRGFFHLKQYFLKNLKNISISFVFIFVSFSLGNLFGIFSKKIENSFFIIFLMNFWLEFFCFIIYSQKIPDNKIIRKRYLNLIKQGFLIGIFVEAFKVGS
jgi:hypothetical protein